MRDMSTRLRHCGRRNLVTYQVEPKEAWRFVLVNRRKSICPSCFDAEAEHAIRWHKSGAPRCSSSSYASAGSMRRKSESDATKEKGVRIALMPSAIRTNGGLKIREKTDLEHRHIQLNGPAVL